ncbi:MAG: hypothetical protein JW779_13625 [Candidatus Thorarchaeota archaeon]|nr:hypothetical protein [Candidatus Thorarchaeota archaeon]
MKSVRVLVICSNASTFLHILRTLESSQKYDFTIFGYGVTDEFIPLFHRVTLFDKVSHQTDLVSYLLKICNDNGIDVIIPASTEYLRPLCDSLEQFREINTEPIIPVSNPLLLEILSQKSKLLEYSKNVLLITVPEYKTIENHMKIVEAASDLGYPQKSILFSPSLSSQTGSLRLVDSSRDIRKIFFDEKPDAVFTTLERFSSDIGHSSSEITAMQFDCSTEYTAEVLCRKGQTFAIIVYPSNPLSQEMSTFSVLTKDQHYPTIEKIVKKVVEGFGLSYSIGMRIWIDSEGNARLVDVIPHLRNDIILSLHGGINFPELMVDMAFHEFDYSYKPEIKWGLKMQQVWLELLNYEGAVWKTEM